MKPMIVAGTEEKTMIFTAFSARRLFTTTLLTRKYTDARTMRARDFSKETKPLLKTPLTKTKSINMSITASYCSKWKNLFPRMTLLTKEITEIITSTERMRVECESAGIKGNAKRVAIRANSGEDRESTVKTRASVTIAIAGKIGRAHV